MRLKYEFEMMEIDNETIAIPIGTNSQSFKGVIKLNETGAKIFELIKEGRNLESIIDDMRFLYPENVDDIPAYVYEFVDNLKKDGVLE